jgi:amino acid transporter
VSAAPPGAAAAGAAAPVRPIRHLGPVRIAGLGINSVIGGGIFVLPAVVAALAGPASLFAYAAAGAFVFGVGLVLAQLASRHDLSGGPYRYVQHAFGGFWGFQAGWLFCLARLSAAASLLNAFARYLGGIVPGGSGLAGRALLVAAAALFITGTNIAGIRQTARATTFLAAIKIAPLLALGIAGLAFVDPALLRPAPVEPMAFLRAVLLLTFAFSGFEIATVSAEESLRPRRDVPLALMITIASVCALYLLVHAVALGLLPGLADERAPLAAIAGRLAGNTGLFVMIAAAGLSTAGCSLASLVGGTRVLYAMSATRQIPPFIGALHPGRRTPVNATLMMGAAAAVLAVWGRYEWLSAISAGTRLLVYLGCCLACLRPAHADPAIGAWPASGATAAPAGPAPRFGGRPAALLTAGAVAVVLCGLELTEAVAGMIGLGIGMVLYLAAGRARAAFARGGAGS